MAEFRHAGMGRHKVKWEYDPCVEKGEMEEESLIVITVCKDDEFTCEYTISQLYVQSF